MAVRSPLKNDSGNLKEMTSAEVDSIVDQIIYQYSLNPSVSLSVVSSGGNLGTITDTRLQAGAMLHLSFGAILGATAWRKKDEVEIHNNRTDTTS